MKKQLYTHEATLSINDADTTLSLSKYADCLLVIVNQTGAIGSLLQGQVLESAGELAHFDAFQDEQNQREAGLLYQIRVLFGSTEIDFYQLLLRRIMSLIWEENKCEGRFRVLLNVSLPVLKSGFKEEEYYSAVIEGVRGGLGEVL